MKLSTVFISGIFLITIGYFFIPYPITQEHYSTAAYSQYSYQQVSKLPTTFNPSPLRAGAAKVDITPKIGIPMGGYGALTSRLNTGHSQRVFARAITLVNNTQKVVFLNIEFLLPLPLLVNEVVRKSGLKREQIFFSASHTHSGPGGYSKKFSSELALGSFHAEYFDQLVTQLVKAITLSQENLAPITLNYSQTILDQPLAQKIAPSRFNKNKSPQTQRTSLHFLTLNTTETTLAIIASANAHSTVYKSTNHKINGDYPGILTNIMEEKCQCIAAFAAGSVGGNGSPSMDNKLALEDAIKQYAEFLYAMLSQHEAPSKTYQISATNIVSNILPVQLPESVFHLNENWKLNPKLVKLLLHDENTYLHLLSIGKLVFVGFPADYSEQLSLELIEWGRNNQTLIWPSSFNGDYVGYIMSSAQYDIPHYTTRNMNFFGKWAGDYMNDLVKAYLLKQ